MKNYIILFKFSKIISKKSLNPGEFDRLREEAYILSSLRHPNIVKFKEVLFFVNKILAFYRNFYIVILRTFFVFA